MGQRRCSLSSLSIVKPAPSQAAQEVGIQHVLLLGPRLSLTRSLSQPLRQHLSLPTAKLLPKDLYEPLKEKWDDLKEVSGSSHVLGPRAQEPVPQKSPVTLLHSIPLIVEAPLVRKHLDQ